MIRQWRALEPWVAVDNVEHRSSNFPLVELRELLRPRKEPVVVSGTFGDWSPITVHLNGEVSIRDRSTPFKGAMFAAYPGDIVFSKIDARSGAITMLPESIAKAVVTPEFPVFVADHEKLRSAFLQRLLRTGGFLSALRSKATGHSGRKRVTPEAFLELRIPLPTAEEQDALIADFDLAVSNSNQLQADAASKEADAENVFSLELGLPALNSLPDKPILIASFTDMDRWSHDAILRRTTGPKTGSTSWDIVALRDVVADLENGWSPKCLERPAANDEWGVLKLGAVSFGTFDQTENKALPASLKPKPDLEVKVGDVLISRANVARLVGAIAIVKASRPRLMLCDKIFRVKWASNSKIAADFLVEVLRTPDVRHQIETKLTGTSPTMKNISKPALLDLQFPFPPLTEQKKLVAVLSAEREKANDLRAASAARMAAAWREFEAAIYEGLPT